MRNRNRNQQGRSKNSKRHTVPAASLLEPMEQRLLLTGALLGVEPGMPLLKYDNGGTAAYHADLDKFVVHATPLTLQLVDGGASRRISGTRGLDIALEVDSNGILVGGVAGDDLTISGTVDPEGDGTSVSGVLLTGEIQAMGWLDTGLATDVYDFRFTPTGGALFDYYSAYDIGITMTSEASTFGGNFNTDFGGGAKGDLGGVEKTQELPATIGDFVWNDANANGIQDSGEAGIDGATVNLLDAANIVIGTTTTDNTGFYQFPGLEAGTYKIEVVAPTGMFASPQDQGSDDAADSDGDALHRSGAITVAAGDNNDTVDFGFYAPASIGNYVWNDTNANGIQDSGEAGIAGVAVNLLNGANNVIASTSTDNTGFYQFPGLDAGTYKIEVVAPTGMFASPQDQGSDDAADSDGDALHRSGAITVAAGDNNDTVDFGFYAPASIGNYVWNDANANGIQDGGEAGIAGVAVNLLNNVGGVIGSTTTDGSGHYNFGGLAVGTYSVAVDATNFASGGALAGLAASTPDQGSDDAVDSDGDVVLFTSGAVILSAGQVNDTVDFGFYRPLVSSIDIEKYVKVASATGAEGLTPGYWKQCQHFDDWTEYLPSDKFEEVFGVNVCGNPTLLDALRANGGGKDALMRHATAALLNAAHPGIDYAYSVSEVILMVQQAFATGSYEQTKNLFCVQNEKGADLKTPACKDDGLGEDADTPNGLSVKVGQTVVFNYVVTNTGETDLANITVSDDNATAGNTSDDFAPQAVTAGGYNVGDADQDGVLDVGESWLYRATTIATAGLHTNIGTAVGTVVGQQSMTVTDSDAANYTAGCVCPPANSSISGIVYVDKDNDGRKDCNESGIGSVKIVLTGVDVCGNNVSKTTYTDCCGKYTFGNLKAGTYAVSEVQPSKYVDGKDSVGSVGGTLSNDKVSKIDLLANTKAINYNFGEQIKKSCSCSPCGGWDWGWSWLKWGGCGH